MTEDKKNPFAFPVTDGKNFCQDGMTLRDYFAAKAMQGLLAANATYNGKTNDRDKLATDAYAHADAMLKARPTT